MLQIQDIQNLTSLLEVIRHCWTLSTNFWKQKVGITQQCFAFTPQENFSIIIWIFTEGAGIESRISFKIFSTLQSWPVRQKILVDHHNIRMSHWHCRATEGVEFWISCKWLKLQRKAGRLQLIQNLAPSAARWRQCDIRIHNNLKFSFLAWYENSTTEFPLNGKEVDNQTHVGINSEVVDFWTTDEPL